MSEYTELYDEVRGDAGKFPEELQDGQTYRLRIKVTDKDLWARPYGDQDFDENTVRRMPRVRMALIALDPVTGDATSTSSFYNWKLGADTHYFVREGEEGQWEVRPDVSIPGNKERGQPRINSYKDELRKVVDKTKSFMRAIGVSPGVDDGGPEGAFGFFNVDEWDGKEFIGKWGVFNDNGFLRNWASLNDEKNGLASLQPAAGTQAEAVGVAL